MASDDKNNIITGTSGEASESDTAELDSGQLPEITFSSFVVSLGMQALMALGEMPSPDGASIERNKEAAQQSIEILRVLRDKTKGNLTADENHLLEEILHNVRIAFVRG